MTADRLDEQAEARIREACGVVNHANPELESWQDYTASPKCTCRIQRAAILADREAREPDLWNLLEVAWGVIANASGGDWTQEPKMFQAVAAMWRDDYFSALRNGPQPTNERANVDALAEALRAARSYYIYDNKLGGKEHTSAEIVRWDALLAAHDKLRGR